MKANHSEIELIEQYLEGSLDVENRRLVEKKMSNDKNYSRDIEQYRLLIDGIKYSGRNEILAKLKKWDMELPENIEDFNDKSSHRRFIWYYAAASIAIFVVAGILIYSNLKFGYDRIVADHYQPYNYFPETSRGDEINKNSIEEIFEYYDRGEYAQALQMIQNLETNKKTERVNFILANIHQAMKNYNEAIPIYGQIIKTGSIHTNGSKWYMALCYLSIDNIENARPLLEELKGSNSSYTPKAKNLLKDLD